MIALKKGIAYSGVNFEPVPALLVNPMVPWNPQRNDVKTPIRGIQGIYQCMGNSVQNSLRFFGQRNSKLRTLSTMDTYSYYHGLELWLANKKRNAKSDIYYLKLQSEYAAGIFRKNNASIEVSYGKANVPRLVDYLETTGNIAIFGISVPRKGRQNFRHILNIAGITPDRKGLVAIDPYGYYPYSQRFGFCVVYELAWLKKYGTVMVTFNGGELL